MLIRELISGKDRFCEWRKVMIAPCCTLLIHAKHAEDLGVESVSPHFPLSVMIVASYWSKIDEILTWSRVSGLAGGRSSGLEKMQVRGLEVGVVEG